MGPLEDYYDDYESRPGKKPDRKRSWRKWLLRIGILIIAAVVVFVAHWALVKYTTKKPTTGNKSKTQVSQQTRQSSITTQTKHYSSTQFGLEFDYPADWTITDTDNSGKLTAVSPTLRLVDAQGQAFSGQVQLLIRNKQQALPEFDKGNAVATRSSEKITYTKPSGAQRGSTYISFLHYASSTEAPTMDGIYITGDVGYQKDQAIPKADFTPVDPVISVTFATCNDAKCSSPTAAGVSSQMWDDVTIAGPLKNMLQSLTIN